MNLNICKWDVWKRNERSGHQLSGIIRFKKLLRFVCENLDVHSMQLLFAMKDAGEIKQKNNIQEHGDISKLISKAWTWKTVRKFLYIWKYDVNFSRTFDRCFQRKLRVRNFHWTSKTMILFYLKIMRERWML